MVDIKKIALITGATSGIGESTAYELAKKYSLILCGRNKEKLNQLEDNLSSVTKVITLKFDVRNHKEVSEKILSLDNSWNNIDLLINNAGNAHGLDFIHEGDIKDWDMMIDTNVKGLLYVTKYVLESMIKNNSGHIINIGSLAGREVYEKGNIYCATKHAVNAISKAMRIDLNKTGIKVSEINPGLVETDFSNVRFKGDSDRAEKVYQGYKALQADDIADIIEFVINRPDHVNIADILVLPQAQATSSIIDKK